ncbi:MAG TPA: MraY family glycosyltransferase [Terriglobales bacterium]|nr:MraY family glycosyltransferase [Terriglobales bacterium]
MMLAEGFGFALLLSLLLTPAGARLAWSTGYLDHPQARKLHTSATALLGGLVVFVSALTAWGLVRLVRGGPWEREALFLLAGAPLVVALGLWDDRHGMHPAVKLAGQFLAAAILLASGRLPGLGLPPALEWVLTALALVALMNAVNFLDNMNGMVGGLSAITLAAFAILSAARGAAGLAVAQLALAGACAGFLPYNFPRARIFLGDAGSLLLGYSLGASAVLAYAGSPPGWGRLGVLLLLAYPAFDLIFVVVNRLREGRKIYVGGRDHSNHRLASVIRCPTKAVLLMWCSTAALCASGLVVLRLNRPMPALLLSALWTILLFWSGLRLSSIPIAPTPAP